MSELRVIVEIDPTLSEVDQAKQAIRKCFELGMSEETLMFSAMQALRGKGNPAVVEPLVRDYLSYRRK